MRGKAVFLVMAIAIPLGAGAVEFTFETGTEGWTASPESTGVANYAASGGVIGFDYVEPTAVFDPMVISPTVAINAIREHWLVLQVNISADPGAGGQRFQVFYANEFGGFSEPRSRAFFVTPNAGWQDVVFDMAPLQGGRDPWQGTVTRFRIDPGSSQADLEGYRCEFDFIAMTDDTDADGIPDDDELFWWGTIDEADETSDHDYNGITDKMEIEFGLDPTVDEGEVLPAAKAWLLLVTTLFLAALGSFRLQTLWWTRQT